jgi:hypothetical protein
MQFVRLDCWCNSCGWTAISCRDKTLRVWDTAAKTCKAVLTGHDGNVTACALSAHGDLLCSSSSDCTMRVWHPLDGICYEVFQEHSSDVTMCALSDKCVLRRPLRVDHPLSRVGLPLRLLTPVTHAYIPCARSLAHAPRPPRMFSPHIHACMPNLTHVSYLVCLRLASISNCSC